MGLNSKYDHAGRLPSNKETRAEGTGTGTELYKLYIVLCTGHMMHQAIKTATE